MAYLTVSLPPCGAPCRCVAATRRRSCIAVFVTVYVLSYGRPDSPFVLVNPSHSAIITAPCGGSVLGRGDAELLVYARSREGRAVFLAACGASAMRAPSSLKAITMS